MANTLEKMQARLARIQERLPSVSAAHQRAALLAEADDLAQQIAHLSAPKED